MVRWRARLQQWNFPAGASVSFAHLEHDKTVLNWQGSQIPLTCFDELTHFSAKQLPMRSVEYATSSSTDIEDVLALARHVVTTIEGLLWPFLVPVWPGALVV